MKLIIIQVMPIIYFARPIYHKPVQITANVQNIIE